MAQRTEKEEPEMMKSVPEALTLCINNCGVVGNPGTNNMCQKCFVTKTASSPSHRSCSTSSSMTSCFDKSSDQDIIIVDQTAVDEIKVIESGNENVVVSKKNRCFGCRKRVGLTGFRCRCGEMFCGEHRYSDRHDCSYDYKTVGREVIARENPVVKASKIVRI